MSLEMKIYRAIAIELDTDAMREKAKKFGKIAADKFGKERGKAQLRNLENIANSTVKVSDVIDYVKKQTARMREWAELGAKMVEFLEKEIPTKRTVVLGIAPLPEDDHRRFREQDISLQLIRGFLHQLVVHFEWELSQEGKKL